MPTPPTLPNPSELLKRLLPPALPALPDLFSSGPFGKSHNTVAAPRKVTPVTRASSSSVTTPETIAYQNRELSKVLLALEAHLNQGCRIAGKACDCCSPKHPLELEKLSEEALTMTSNPVYHEIIRFAHEVEGKASVSAVESGEYEAEYSLLAIQARNLRKRVMGTDKAQAALGMIKSGEIGIRGSNENTEVP